MNFWSCWLNCEAPVVDVVSLVAVPACCDVVVLVPPIHVLSDESSFPAQPASRSAVTGRIVHFIMCFLRCLFLTLAQSRPRGMAFNGVYSETHPSYEPFPLQA